MRWMCGVTLQDGKTSEELRERLDIISVSERVHQMWWYGHVDWKDEGDWVSACRDLSVVGKNGKEEVNKLGKSA